MGSKKRVKCEETIREALEYAGSAIEELKTEIEEWKENLESNDMDHLPKYEEVEECYSTLEDAELETAVEEFISALESASEGVPAKPGCPEHVVGTPCSVCKWSGKSKARALPELKIFDPPEKQDDGRTLIAIQDGDHYVSEFGWTVEKVKAIHQRRVERAEKYNERCAIPARRKPEAEVLPVEGLDEFLLDTTVSYVETRPYGRRSPSRADRCGNACAALEAALDALQPALDALDPVDDRVSELLDALGELREKAEEVVCAEFPGMF